MAYTGYSGFPGGYGPLPSLAPSLVGPPTMPPAPPPPPPSLPYGCPQVMPQAPAYGPLPSIMPQPAPVIAPLPSVPQPIGFTAQPLPYGGGPNPYPVTSGMPGQWGTPGPMIGVVVPPPGVNVELWNWFQAVDADHNGHITANELQRALVNGNWSPFNLETCRLMIGMFDVNRTGTIELHEFVSLWKFIQDWKACFDRFDINRSGNIDANELQNALRTFGYSLSMNFVYLCIRIFDKRCRQSINLDAFIQVCVMLRTLSDKFREKDTKLGGVVTVHYEEFLRMALDNPVV